MYSFSYLEPVCCFMSSSNCCFLTCIQISQEADQVVWYSHLQNFPQFIVIHTVKGFGIVNKAEVDVSLELSSFFHDPTDVGNLISVSSASFSKTSLNICKFMVHVFLKPGLEDFEHYFTSRGAQLASDSRADPRTLASTFHHLLCIYLSRLQQPPTPFQEKGSTRTGIIHRVVS